MTSSYEVIVSRADERLYGHYSSMDKALARSIVMAKQQVSEMLAVAGSWRPRRVLDISAGAGAMIRVLSD
jgi:ubiquinone/menaquinone biosynthesis C-methylase UbiE